MTEAETKSQSEEPRLCTVCKKEIPRSATVSPEAKQYAHYYCGSGCEQRWLQEHYNPDHAVKSE